MAKLIPGGRQWHLDCEKTRFGCSFKSGRGPRTKKGHRHMPPRPSLLFFAVIAIQPSKGHHPLTKALALTKGQTQRPNRKPTPFLTPRFLRRRGGFPHHTSPQFKFSGRLMEARHPPLRPQNHMKHQSPPTWCLKVCWLP